MVNKRFLEMARRIVDKKPIEPIDACKDEGLSKILERDGTGRPILKLTPLEKTVVNTRTQEEYNTLMQVYECGGWKWPGGKLPTEWDDWGRYKEETCVEPGVNYIMNGKYDEGKFGYGSKEFYLGENWKVISTQEFYERQKITAAMRNEINGYFEERDKVKKH